MATSQPLSYLVFTRRWLSFSAPRPQLRLALSVLAVAFVFGLLMAGNTYLAYAKLFGVTLSMAPDALVQDIAAQTHSFLRVSGALMLGLVFALSAVSAATLHRLLGPRVALERQVRALLAGNYGARVALRSGDSPYAELALRLNELAQQLEQAGRR